MKKQLIFICSILILISSCKSRMFLEKNVGRLKNTIVTYNLPKSEIGIKVDYELVKVSPSIFVQKKYPTLLIDSIKHLNNKFFKAYTKLDTIYKITKVTILEKSVPDTSKLYSIKIKSPKWYEIFKKLDYNFEQNNSGFLTSSEYKHSDHTLDFTIDIATGALQYLLAPSQSFNGNGGKVMSNVQAATELMKIIDRINKLEKRKEQIICDELHGFERNSIKDEIAIIDDALKRNYSLIKGKKHSPIKRSKIFTYSPGSTEEIYFSKDSGFGATRGTKILVETKIYPNFNETSSKNYSDYIDYIEDVDKVGLAFNKPVLSDILVSFDNQLVASKTTFIPQLGTVGYLDPKGLNHLSSSLTLDPKTGALLKAGTKSSLLADPSKYGSGIAEAIKGIEKKEESTPTPEIDKQISELEKKFRLLELQTKIDSLESLQIDP